MATRRLKAHDDLIVKIADGTKPSDLGPMLLGLCGDSLLQRDKDTDAKAGGVILAVALVESSGGSVQDLNRRIRSLERENVDLREQRTILTKAVAIFSEPP